MTPARRLELLVASQLGRTVVFGGGAAAVTFAFDPDQSRDAAGRFSPAGGAGAADGGETRPSELVLPDQLAAAFRQRSAAWGASLSPAETGAIGDYTRGGYREVNRALAAAGGDPAKVPASAARSTIDALLSASAKNPPHDPRVTCWRKMTTSRYKTDALIMAAAVAQATGGTLAMPVFGSATLNPAYAHEMTSFGMSSDRSVEPSRRDNKASVLLEIRSRTGLPVGAAGLSQARDVAGYENELLQPPAARYKVLGWKDVKFGAEERRVLQLEEVHERAD